MRRLRVHAAINFQINRAITNHFAQLCNLLTLAGDEFLIPPSLLNDRVIEQLAADHARLTMEIQNRSALALSPPQPPRWPPVRRLTRTTAPLCRSLRKASMRSLVSPGTSGTALSTTT